MVNWTPDGQPPAHLEPPQPVPPPQLLVLLDPAAEHKVFYS